MATYGVTYSGQKAPKTFGTLGTKSLAAMYGGNAAMQPLSSGTPNFAAINQPAPLDALSRVLANGQDTFAQIAPAGAKPPAPPAATASPSSTYQGTDLSADPILTQIKALGQRSAQDASTAALANEKNDLINYGNVNLPQSLRDLIAAQTPKSDALLGDLPANPLLGALGDANTATAAAGNPFSTTKQLANAHDTNVHGIDQASNLANLYYSSTHANQLGDENQNYLGAQNSALENLASLLSGQNNNLLDAVNTAHQNYLTELPAAYQRALDAGSGAPPPPPGEGAPPAADTAPADPGFSGLSSNLAQTSGLAALYQLLQARNGLGGGGGGASRFLTA